MKIKFLDNKGPRWRIVSQLPVGMQILLWFPVNISWNKSFKFASLNLGKFTWQFFFWKIRFPAGKCQWLTEKMLYRGFTRCFIWDKVFKNVSSKFCGRQPLENFAWSILVYFIPYEVRAAPLTTCEAWPFFVLVHTSPFRPS